MSLSLRLLLAPASPGRVDPLGPGLVVVVSACRGAGCRALLVQLFAERGIEATVSQLPPLVPSPYPDLGLSCPHGVRWYAEPTSEQRAAWAQDGTP